LFEPLYLAHLKKIVTHIFILLFSLVAYGQKEIVATLSTENIKIDGVLNEAQWSHAQVVQDFTQITPDAGAPSQHQTTVRVLYDNDALYIGAHCYNEVKNVSRVLSQRDRYNSNTDYFSLMLDTYKDQLNGFVFSVSTEGVQYDAKIYAGDYNSKLDMIWYGEVNHSDSGWTVEMKIPYSAIRFAKKEEQIWGINFTRFDSYNREESSWNVVNPDLDNIVTQAGTLKGLNNIEPPLRLFFSPYFSGYAEHFPKNIPDQRDWTYSLNGGMDIKYGINEAFTLDMTLIPDFGQVVTDNVVLNLSPFEVFFAENRPFFNEGTELFEKSGHFYTRRVGGTPINRWKANAERTDTEVIVDNPIVSQLINASKFSGRNKNGLGIGVFNGISANQYATLRDTSTGETRRVETAPLANYNVVVFDQNLKNNSSVTFTNTNVWRSGETYDANLSALNVNLNNKKNTYFLNGSTAISQKYRSTGNDFGHEWGIGAGKQRGSFTYNLNYFEQSDNYDPNDLGFLFNSNKRVVSSGLAYRIFKPFWKLNSFRASLWNSYERLYAPNRFTSFNYSGMVIATNKKFHTAGINFSGTYTENYDFFEPRSPGRFFIRPTRVGGGGWISSNYQRVFALDVNFNATGYQNTDWADYSFEVSPRVRLGKKVFLIYRYGEAYNRNQRGYAIPFLTPEVETNDIIFGKRDVYTSTNTIDFNYTITNKAGATFRLRHYWSTVKYDEFFTLEQNGRLSPANISSVNSEGVSYFNTSFNAFSIDLVYRWIFSPASEISVVWKNNIFTSDSDANIDYLRNLEQTLATDQLNSISIRVVYFIDYLMIRKFIKEM